MKKAVMTLVMMALVAGVAAAQDFPRVEVFGGYSLMKLGGEMSDLIDEQYDAILSMEGLPSDVIAEKSKWFTKGFNTSVAFNINEYFGIQAGFMNNRNDVFSARSAMEDASMTMAVTDFAFMAGPRFTLRKNDVITPFAHVLFGVDHLKVKQTAQFEGETDSFEESNNGFGIAFGGGLDLTVHRNVAIRMIQVDYLRASHDIGEGGKISSNNVNLSFGMVFRF